jgi:hypothetical protein
MWQIVMELKSGEQTQYEPMPLLVDAASAMAVIAVQNEAELAWIQVERFTGDQD